MTRFAECESIVGFEEKAGLVPRVSIERALYVRVRVLLKDTFCVADGSVVVRRKNQDLTVHRFAKSGVHPIVRPTSSVIAHHWRLLLVDYRYGGKVP